MINIKGDFEYHNYFNSFKFIHDYIYHGAYDSAHTKMIIREYISEQISIEEENEDPATILKYYWEMEDEDIGKNINEMYENLNNDKYEGFSYRWIISILYKVKGYGIEPIEISKFERIMIENILRGTSFYSMREPTMGISDDCYLEYEECIQRLEAAEKDYKKEDEYDSINAIFEIGNGWGDAFCEYRRENKNKHFTEKGFFKYVNVDKCIEAIDKSSVKDLSDFRRGLASMYDFSNISDYFSGDTENLKTLNEKLDKKYESKMKQLNIDYLKELLKKTIKKLEPEE